MVGSADPSYKYNGTTLNIEDIVVWLNSDNFPPQVTWKEISLENNQVFKEKNKDVSYPWSDEGWKSKVVKLTSATLEIPFR